MIVYEVYTPMVKTLLLRYQLLLCSVQFITGCLYCYGVFILLRSVHIIMGCSYHYWVFVLLLCVYIFTGCLYYYGVFIIIVFVFVCCHLYCSMCCISFSALINLMSSERSEREPFAETLI